MLQVLGGVVMLLLLLGWVALCYAFYQKHQYDLDRDRFHKQRSKHLSLWKPDLTLANEQFSALNFRLLTSSAEPMNSSVSFSF